ncbi:MAG TPA: KH domain-containing protein [Polyangiaceae bacterium]|nr:KH domain-containing protein [Polyangiaceae bacterium]
MALKELIETIAQALVDDPDGVEVTELERDHGAVIELRVSKGDIGKVIGKDGRTAQSMRTLLAAASTKVGKRVHLDIVD